ncbi:MAG TPA: carotenoid oxygenase family protein, partial [Sorangium sp.]|nr:carotenoid oxygenase family protein [Sorangium sp.]
GKPLYHSATSRWRRIANGLRGKIKATGNTNVMHWQGKTYALMEASRPLEIEATTLGTYGSSHLGGVVGMAFSAHPHRVVSKRTTFNFGLEFGFDVGWPPRVTSKLALYALPDEGRGRKLGEVELPWVTMVHDFAVSEQHMVFVICPAKLNVLKVLSGHPDMGEYFDWDEASHAELLVVPINDPSRALRLPLPARWVFHLSNAFERDGQLLIDWVQYPDFEVFAALGSQGSIADIRAARLQRLVLDLGSGKLRSDEVLWNHSSDFPVLPPGRVGHAYTTCWYTHFGDAETGGGVSRVDVESGAVDSWTPGRGYSPSEAVFVPRPGAQADDDGWLLPLVYDGWARKSFFAVLDAARPSAGPLAKLWYDQPLPVTFHGTFIPATS